MSLFFSLISVHTYIRIFLIFFSLFDASGDNSDLLCQELIPSAYHEPGKQMSLRACPTNLMHVHIVAFC